MHSPSCRLLPVLLLLLLASACGGSGARPTPPPEPDPPFVPPEQEDVRLDTTPAGSALSVFPRIVAGGGNLLYVVWYDRRNGLTDVYFSRSLDGGASWSASDRRLDTDLPGVASSNVPEIAADGDRVYVAWEDTRGGLSEVRFNRSVDAGATWLADDVRLDAATPDGSSFRVDVAASGERVWVVWEDDQAGEEDIYLNRSEDAGTTWLPAPLRLDTDVPGAGASTVPRIVSVGDVVLVVWQDTRDGEADIRLNRSVDGGRTWLAADVRLDSDVAGDAASLGPEIAFAGAVAVVVWQDERSGVYEIRGRRSTDGGLGWGSEDFGIDRDPARTRDARRPVVGIAGSRVVVAWEDERAGLPDVFVNRSLDAGATWLDVDLRLDTDPPGTGRSLAPAVSVGDTRVFVAFADDRKGRFDVLLQVSEDGGATWREKETRLNTDPLGTANALAPRLVGSGVEARGVWYDERDGPGDIRFNRAR